MQAYVAQLSDDGLLHLAGPDVPGFLQGQLTCDTRAVNGTLAAQGALCTPQGRVITDCRVLELESPYLALRLSRSLLAATAKVLARYAVFSRTTVDANDDRWCVYGCWGSDAGSLVESVFGGCPQARDACHSGSGFLVCQADDRGDQFECYVDRAAQPGLATSLASAALPAPETHWQLLEMQRGLVRVTAGQDGRHLPQALNYDLAGLVNFRKGCYTGQEVIARLHYRGETKRRAFLFEVASAAADAPCNSVLLGNGERVGEIVRSVAVDTGDGTALQLMAVVKVAAATQPLHLDLPDGPALQPQHLPYEER